MNNPNHWMHRLFPTARRLLLERSLRSLDLTRTGHVLIVGAGYDPYHHMVRAAKQYIRVDIASVPGCTDVLADALALPFKEGHFNCVLAVECMEHLADPFLFVRELARVLKAGGTVILTVPFMCHQHPDPYDYWRPTGMALERLFSSFADVEVTPQGNRMHVICDLLTTAFSPNPILFPLRLLNHLLVRLPHAMERGSNTTTAPSGFLLVAKK